LNEETTVKEIAEKFDILETEWSSKIHQPDDESN